MNGKPSSPVLRGLGASDGARLLDSYPVSSERNVGTGRPLDKDTQYGIRQFLLVAATKSIGLYKNSYIRHNLNY